MVKRAYSLETKLACIEMKKAGKSNKIICLRMKPITTQLKLKLSVGQLPASAEPFATPCQGAHLCTKLCGFQVWAILQKPSLRHVLVNYLNRLFRKRQPMVILLTETKLVLQRLM